MSKLFGYDFAGKIQLGHQNAATDALSCRLEPAAALLAISSPTFVVFYAHRTELANNTTFESMHDQVLANIAKPTWSLVDGLLLHEGRMFVPAESPLWPQLLDEAHGSGHEGVQKTLHRLRTTFYHLNANRKYVNSLKGVLFVSAIRQSISILQTSCNP